MVGKRIAVFSLFAVLALALAVFASSGTHAATFKPYTNFSLESSTGGATTGSTAGISIPGNDYNYEDSAMLSFYPASFTSTPGVTMPIGAGVGVLDAAVHISVAGTGCNQALKPPDTSFPLYNASVDIYDELSEAECAWILTVNPPPDDDPANGLPDYLDRYPFFLNAMLDPDGDCDPTATGDPGVCDPDDPGSDPALQPIARYAGHSFVAGNAVIIQFLVFNAGQFTEVGGVYSQMGPEVGAPTFIVLDNPFDTTPSPGAIHDFCTPLETTTELYGITIGNPRVGINDDCDADGGSEWDLTPASDCPETQPNDVTPSNCCYNDTDDDGDGFVNDGCPQLGATGESGTDCENATDDDNDMVGFVRGTNAPDETGILGSGTHMYRNYSQTERDADGDGFENDLDPCPYTTDAGWDPRQSGSQTADDDAGSGDGLPDSCDPDDETVNADQDYDGYSNRQDNCPLVKNGLTRDNQADSELPGAPDLGPGPDAIGDACDDSDDDGAEDGAAPGTCNDGIDNGGSDGIDGNDPDCKPYMDKGELDACTNPHDDDDDGYINDGCPPKNDAETDCGPGEDPPLDDDHDGLINDGCDAVGDSEEGLTPDPADIWGDYPQTGGYSHRMPWSAAYVGPGASDSDGDGYSDALENALGSDPNTGSESDGSVYGGANCFNAVDDDGDTYVNDGCPKIGWQIESGAECAKYDAVSTDHGSSRPADVLEDSIMVGLGCGASGCVNDGCPVIGVPESLVIDKEINAAMADAPTKVPQSCNDGVDNDGDGKVDAADDDYSVSAKGCDATKYDSDDDADGVANDDDNCPTDWNPEQVDSDNECTNDVDDDQSDAGEDHAANGGIGYVNDGCDQVGTTGESGDDCNNAVDDDGDGWVNDGCDPVGNDSEGPTDGVGDACDDDDDNDGFTDHVEWWTGNDSLDNCSDVHAAWPMDFNQDKKLNILDDVLEYRGNIGKKVGQEPEIARRLDLNADGKINILDDVLLYRGKIGNECV